MPLRRLVRSAACTLAIASLATVALADEPSVTSAPASASAPAKPRKPRKRTSAPAATAASAAAGSASGPASSSAPAGFDPAKATGHAKLTLSLATPIRLGGFSFTAAYDASRIHVADPTTSPALTGYLCQPNLAVPGSIRFNCAGIVNEDRGGLLATFEIAYAGAAPKPSDFQVSQFEVVNDLAVKVEGVHPVLAVEPLPAH